MYSFKAYELIVACIIIVIMPRSQKGSKNPKAILKEEEIFTIRNLYKNKSYSQIALGVTFGVNQSTISRIVRGKRW